MSWKKQSPHLNGGSRVAVEVGKILQPASSLTSNLLLQGIALHLTSIHSHPTLVIHLFSMFSSSSFHSDSDSWTISST